MLTLSSIFNFNHHHSQSHNHHRFQPPPQPPPSPTSTSTKGGSTTKLVAKYRPAVPILSVVVPVLSTDSFDWTCSDKAPPRQSLVYRGLVPLLAEGSAKATDAESTEVILEAALKSATARGLYKAKAC
ncbi:putative pyruvate kinase [Helianthus annuus]|nr:putative pyruvate kinase [Helianthus annuus]